MPFNADLKPVGEVRPPVLELDQFWRSLGDTLCFRPTCDGCRWNPTCQREETTAKIGPGLNLRRAFRARPSYLLAAIDYKGIELRVAAQISGERFWSDAYINGRDPHTEMAKAAFKTNAPSKSERDAAKCANFGNLYLGTVHTLQRQSALTMPEAVFIWTEWWKNVPTYKHWTECQKRIAETQKKVYTLFHRKRDLTSLIEEAENPTKGKKGKSGWPFIHRTAVNSPIQGTSADLIKMAMVNVRNWIKKDAPDVRMLLTVHDELVFEIKDDQHIFDTARQIAKIMSLPELVKFNWRVPIECDIEIGPNWAELYDINKLDKKSKEKGDQNQNGAAPVRLARDGVVLIVNAKLTEHNLTRLELAIEKASKPTGEVVLVPLKLMISGQTYRSGTEAKVNEMLLRQLVNQIPGVEVQDLEEVRITPTIEAKAKVQ